MRSFRISIQEDMLPGPTLKDRYLQAADLGVHGIEFWSQTLPDQTKEIVRLNGTGGVTASSINNGRRSRFLDPDPNERQKALSELMEAISLAGQVGAAGVVFVPHFFDPLLPDLSPFMTPVELERALLSAQLEGLAEHALSCGVELWVEPVNHYETHLLVCLDDASSLIKGINTSSLKIVADLFHMALDEPDIPTSIRSNATTIGHVHLADSNRRLPGDGRTDFAAALGALDDIEYSGWMAFECGEPGQNMKHASEYMRDLPASLKYLRSV
ncbi:MAG TPA: sugar phosphate isomerase/epimerase family protein [Anaerolineales bacterium]|nr:sugar phosphate isomerase/epimerase family protein [Anaerolineales bacterium]